MNRRTALKQFFILAGGLMIASSCTGGVGEASIELRHIVLSAADEALIGDLVEAIIPGTDSPGAKELNLHLFVMKMLDDCHSSEDQEAFIKGLKKVAKAELKTESARLAYLQTLREDVFFDILKKRTVQGYLNSEYIMKNKLIYELVPGHYDGAVKVNT
ncbi:gluconate 2-dehydrogenase subunit 3 family protein [Sphingobacterium faecale]|uniref:Gluconate 2-dehydrogenase subunit 3 family protein n=1 Tax=Sphingobacterium faecale TaxID=2803775 RepID=A0ABS1RA09_9SPHI|nr:gluconate 2-dehydrogenase subunit 3 family protein [Sphingobacterium faecale]MBL1410842.1 gluconate 2-dehydrogenase subunit 3 family protein [Sphingobacterium faecale]